MANSRWRRQPPYGTRLDRSHPLAVALAAAWPCNEGAGATLYDGAGIYPVALTLGAGGWTPAVGPGGGGTALNFDGAATYGAATLVFGFGPYTLAGWARPVGASGVGNVFTAGSTGLYATQLRQDAGSWNMYQSVNGSGDVNATYAGLVAGAWQHVCGTWDGATIRLYVGGVLRSSAAAANNYHAGSAFSIGADAVDFTGGTKGQYFNGKLAGLAAWTRCLQPAEVFALADDPWAMFARPAPPLLVPGAAGPAVLVRRTPGRPRVGSRTPGLPARGL